MHALYGQYLYLIGYRYFFSSRIVRGKKLEEIQDFENILFNELAK